MSTHGVKRNLRGAQTYAPPVSKAYRDNHDRIFGARPAPGVTEDLPADSCDHVYYGHDRDGERCKRCHRCGHVVAADQ